MDVSKRQLIERRLGTIAKVAAVASLFCVGFIWTTLHAKNADRKARVEAAQSDLDRERRDVSELQERLQRKEERVQAVAKEVAGELDRRNKLVVTMTEIVKRVERLQQQKDTSQLRRNEIAQELKRMDEHYVRAKEQTNKIDF